MRSSSRVGVLLPAAATWLAVAWSAGGPPPARADALVREPCDCCKLICIEAEIIKAQEQRDFYKDAAGRTGWTQETYEAAEREAADLAESHRVKHFGGMDSCGYFNPLLAGDMEKRDLMSAGFSWRTGDNGAVKDVNYSLKANPLTCTLNKKAIEYAPKVTACEGIGMAQVAHEEKHVENCKKRPEAERELTPSQTAEEEVRGYNQEIFKLEELRFAVAAQCMAKSCDQKDAWNAAAEEMILGVEDVLQRGAPKPPSDSPTSRKGKAAKKAKG